MFQHFYKLINAGQGVSNHDHQLRQHHKYAGCSLLVLYGAVASCFSFYYEHLAASIHKDFDF